MTCASLEVVADWPLHLLTTEYLSLLAQTYYTTLLNIFKRRFLNVLPFLSLPKPLVRFRSGSSLRVSNLKFKTALIEERRFNNKTLVTSQCNKTNHSGLLLFNRWFSATLSSAEASLCRREAGEKEIESARGTVGRGKREKRLPSFPSSHLPPPPPSHFLFFDYCYFYCDTQQEPLRRRELALADG